MRADAERNAGKLRAAAAEVFQERGLQAPVKEIARRAGVSHGTLYNLFGTREALIDDVVAGLADDRLRRAAEVALAEPDPWEGFAGYVLALVQLQATDPAVGDVITRSVPGAHRIVEVCERAHAAGQQIIERAQAAGGLRPDFDATDLFFIFGANAVLARVSESVAAGSWRRGVHFVLDGLRTTAARPLPVAPLTREQLIAANERLGAS